MSTDNSVVSILSRTFPSPDWDNKKHFITKYQRNHDKYFIEAMCASFVLGSICPACDKKKAPSDPQELARHNNFLSIQKERCDMAARCIHAMCVEMGKRLTHVRHSEHDHLDHYDIVFEPGSYLHYVRIMSELKAKCGKSGGVVISWEALHAGKKPRMFLPHYLLVKEFVHTTPYLSECARSLLAHVEDDMNNVIFNDSPQEIPIVRQIFEFAAENREPLPSDESG